MLGWKPMQYLSIRVDHVPALPPFDGASNFGVIGGYAAAIIRALEARGVATDAVLKASGMQRVPPNDPFARVTMASLHKLFDAAVELTDDPYFGLYAANFLHPSNMHALGFGLLASASLRDLSERLVTYFRALSNGWQPRLVECGDTVRLEYPQRADTPHLAEDSL